MFLTTKGEHRVIYVGVLGEFFRTAVWLEGITANHSHFESVRRKTDGACCFHLVWEGYQGGSRFGLQGDSQGGSRYGSHENLQNGCWWSSREVNRGMAGGGKIRRRLVRHSGLVGRES